MPPLKPKIRRAILGAKKKLKGKKLTNAELGYERDPKTGRLTKPGTKKHNLNMDYLNDNKRAVLEIYEKRVRENPTELNKTKLIDKQKQLNRHISGVERQRALELKQAEASRLKAIKARRINHKIKGINSLLSVKSNTTVAEIIDELSTKIHDRTVRVEMSKQKNKNIKNTTAFQEIHRKISAEYKMELDRQIKPGMLQEMNYEKTVNMLNYVFQIIEQKYNNQLKNQAKKE